MGDEATVAPIVSYLSVVTHLGGNSADSDGLPAQATPGLHAGQSRAFSRHSRLPTCSRGHRHGPRRESLANTAARVSRICAHTHSRAPDDLAPCLGYTISDERREQFGRADPLAAWTSRPIDPLHPRTCSTLLAARFTGEPSRTGASPRISPPTRCDRVLARAQDSSDHTSERNVASDRECV